MTHKFHGKNHDLYLDTQVTKVLHVDGNRTDSYVANGSPTKPFKTIQSAIDVSSGATKIIIAAGTYTEQITLKSSIILVGKRGSVNITYNNGDVITRPSGVSGVWLNGLQISVTGGGGFAAIKDVSNSGYIQIRDSYASAMAAGDFALDALNTQNLWLFRTDFDGRVRADNVTNFTLDACQIINANQSGSPALLLKSCVNPIYKDSSIANSCASGDALEIDGCTGGSIALAQITSSNGKAVYVHNTTTLLTLANVGLVSSTFDLDLEAGSSIYFGSNMYNPTKLNIGGTLQLVQYDTDMIDLSSVMGGAGTIKDALDSLNTGWSGSFYSLDSETVTVVNGRITSVVAP